MFGYHTDKDPKAMFGYQTEQTLKAMFGSNRRKNAQEEDRGDSIRSENDIIKAVFMHYEKASTGKDEGIDSSKFMKLCRDYRLISIQLKQENVDILFLKYREENRRMKFSSFLSALSEIAKQKNCTLPKLIEHITKAHLNIIDKISDNRMPATRSNDSHDVHLNTLDYKTLRVKTNNANKLNIADLKSNKLIIADLNDSRELVTEHPEDTPDDMPSQTTIIITFLTLLLLILLKYIA